MFATHDTKRTVPKILSKATWIGRCLLPPVAVAMTTRGARCRSMLCSCSVTSVYSCCHGNTWYGGYPVNAAYSVNTLRIPTLLSTVNYVSLSADLGFRWWTNGVDLDKDLCTWKILHTYESMAWVLSFSGVFCSIYRGSSRQYCHLWVVPIICVVCGQTQTYVWPVSVRGKATPSLGHYSGLCCVGKG